VQSRSCAAMNRPRRVASRMRSHAGKRIHGEHQLMTKRERSWQCRREAVGPGFRQCEGGASTAAGPG
jgi:hypothetical protein